jgi:BlaI family transcriptional regulator, penicillinase repressor
MARFTANELEVMRILWEHEELKPAEIQARFPRSIKNPALRSQLSILVEKGHIARRKVGKAYFYRAKTRQDRAFRTMMRDMLNVFCAGSARTLVAHMIQAEELSNEDLLELRRMADGDTQAGSRAKRKRQ